ncbi:MAG: hydrogenase assembly protein HupF [Actinobacteria bacterium RBG_19FT_COMBO_54_7]|uniref:Hydrogenase assembly protein HupF n=1 Tax=Candidatus Solincola sediminis TaxID=1797199 RepID=A0A1F2WF93_9ACTN|nr:MAG: hydrogenase assembly protein HupF [Candidatus Solincola sediminis]OFW57788.1 MAG: hydrogenase assembly protein HupF [Candidatus Solincola sediminis]OFW68796.1 MAG: hydrogenase assembly protein HupF [Actinobacteria bacterium RBG_19FT_COMBO_54_7]
MCLAIPGKVLELGEDDSALVEIGGVKKRVSLMLVDGAGLGDYVLIHAGFAIEKINAYEARRTLELFEEIAKLDGTT